MSDEILDELIALGASSRTIIAVATLIAEAKVTKDRRHRDAERKRLSRDATLRSKQPRVRGHPRMSQDVTGPPPVDTTPPKKQDSKRNLAMPIDFALTDSDVRFAADRGFDEQRIKFEYQRFCDHATANGRRQADWHAAWRTWVTSPYQRTNGNGSANGRHVETPKRRTVLDVAREFTEHLDARQRDRRERESQANLDLNPQPDGRVPKG